jgi:hypothetical protein
MWIYRVHQGLAKRPMGGTYDSAVDDVVMVGSSSKHPSHLLMSPIQSALS